MDIFGTEEVLTTPCGFWNRSRLDHHSTLGSAMACSTCGRPPLTPWVRANGANLHLGDPKETRETWYRTGIGHV